MGFWVFMLMVDMLVPVSMIGFGKAWSKAAPKEINAVFGYRTDRSMKNRDTWDFAHRYCGKIWLVCGSVLLPLSIAPMLLVIGKNEDIVGALGGILCAVQLIPLIGSIFSVERALNKVFDKDGIRR